MWAMKAWAVFLRVWGRLVEAKRVGIEEGGMCIELIGKKVMVGRVGGRQENDVTSRATNRVDDQNTV